MNEITIPQNEIDELRKWFWDFLDRRTDLTASHIAAYSAMARSGCEAFLSRRMAESGRVVSEKMVYEFRRIRQLIESGEILRPEASALTVQRDSAMSAARRSRPRRRDLYKTENVAKIAQVLDYCAENAAIGVVTADYGVGKTTAVQHWRLNTGLTTPNCYFEFDEFSRCNINDCLHLLAELVGAQTGRRRGADTMRSVTRYLCDSPMLIICDQCETVKPRVLQMIRQIWDGSRHAGTGIVLLSSPLLAERLHAPTLKKEIGALTSRVGVWAQLQGVDKAEASGILQQEGVKDIEPAALDLLLRMSQGSMRRLMAAIDLLIAKHSGKRVTERTIEGVASNLWGMQTIDPRRRAV